MEYKKTKLVFQATLILKCTLGNGPRDPDVSFTKYTHSYVE